MSYKITVNTRNVGRYSRSLVREMELNPRNLENLDQHQGAMNLGDNPLDNSGHKIKEEIGGLSSMVSMVTGANIFMRKHRRKCINVVYILLLVAYLCYYGYAMYYHFGDEASIRLTVFTGFGLVFICVRLVSKTTLRRKCDVIAFKVARAYGVRKRRLVVRWILYVLTTAGIAIYVGLNTAKDKPGNLYSLMGIPVFVILMVAMSNNRRKINWHTVYWGIALQFILGALVLKTQVGSYTISWVAERLLEFVTYSDVGSEFVFGEKYAVHNFAFKVMPSVILFCTMISLLIYMGVIQAIVNVLGGLLAFCLDVSPPEAVAAVANIVLGGAEVTLLVQKYLKTMQSSRMYTIMIGSMASCGGSAFIMFSSFGVPISNLLAASAMSAPAAIACAKIVYPDNDDDIHDKKLREEEDVQVVVFGDTVKVNGLTSDESHTLDVTSDDTNHVVQNHSLEDNHLVSSKRDQSPDKVTEKKTENGAKRRAENSGPPGDRVPHSVIEAIMIGISQGVRLVTNICATLIVFLALTEFANATCQWLGERVGLSEITLSFLLSYVFYPFAFVMGVQPGECLVVGNLLGIRAVVSVAVAYSSLGKLILNRDMLEQYSVTHGPDWRWVGKDIFLPATNETLINGVISERSEVISSYALCGFSSVSTMGIAIAIFVALAPSRIPDVSRMSRTSLITSTFASYMTACVAGLLA